MNLVQMPRHLLVEPPTSWLSDYCSGRIDHPNEGTEYKEGLLAFLTCRASTRSRVSVAGAAQSLGLGFIEIPWESFYGNETVHHCAAKNLVSEAWSLRSLGVVALIVRPSSHEWLKTFATESPIPIVNACSNLWHPLQAIADLRAIHNRFHRLDGIRVIFVGNGHHPTISSLATLGKRLGLKINILALKTMPLVQKLWHAKEPVVWITYLQ